MLKRGFYDTNVTGNVIDYDKVNLKNSKLRISMFGIATEDIKHNLSDYYSMFTKKQAAVILKSYYSIEDYVNIMYGLKFIKKMDYNEIANELNIAVTNVYKRYYDLGWKEIGSFEENEIQFQKLKDRLNSKKNKIMTITRDEIITLLCKSGRKKDEIISQLDSVYKKAQKCRRDSYEPYGFNNAIQYANSMYYLGLP
jgi:hypothetical protein